MPTTERGAKNSPAAARRRVFRPRGVTRLAAFPRSSPGTMSISNQRKWIRDSVQFKPRPSSSSSYRRPATTTSMSASLSLLPPPLLLQLRRQQHPRRRRRRHLVARRIKRRSAGDGANEPNGLIMASESADRPWSVHGLRDGFSFPSSVGFLSDGHSCHGSISSRNDRRRASGCGGWMRPREWSVGQP